MGSASTYPNSTAGFSPPISLLCAAGIPKKTDQRSRDAYLAL